VRTADLVETQFEPHRRELTGYCYRMLGSLADAEDAVQQTVIQAWRGVERFEGRSTVRTWLHRIATNVCIDMLRGRERRAMPMGLGPASLADDHSGGTPLPEERWVMPAPDDRVLPDTADPADLAAARESVRLAFLAALQELPGRQRAVLILRDVLRWPAADVAGLLDTSVASVNSALQRARATLAARGGAGDRTAPLAGAERTLLARYVDAFERYDVARLTELLHEDAVQSMPPLDLWLRGATEIGRWMLGPGIGCRGSILLPTAANGGPAFAQYRSDGAGGHTPWSLQVIEIDGDRISAIHCFLVPRLFATFGMPMVPGPMIPGPRRRPSQGEVVHRR
jgi:RNA polymerase sigma-70 factor (ECF subfamily)